ncbi:MAG TPA: hypothetical protein VIM65_08140 [Cyclobacteriaceae bacterium]
MGSIQEPPVRTKPEVDIEILTSISPTSLEDSFVYVHCYFDNLAEEMLIRIWKTTFLIDQSTGTKVQLVHAENISMAPAWTVIPGGMMFHFLLIFSGLPKSCKQFDLVEEIPQPGGFCVRHIARNDTDVYHIDI